MNSIADESWTNLLQSLESLPDGDPWEEKESASKDPYWLLENSKLYIKTKDAQLVPLELNHAQRIVLDKIKELDGKPVRILLLKARQLGQSTLIEGVIYSRASQNENVNALVIADDLEGSTYLFEMSKLFQEELETRHPHLAPKLKKSNEKRLVFDQIRSQIRVGSAMASREASGSRVGRKFTFHLVHLSECAFFPSLKSLLGGLMQSVPKRPGTIVVLETTANGLGGDFYDLWQAAKAGENDWVPIFLPWFVNPEYSMPLSPGETLEPLDEDEQALVAKHDLTLEQLKWRRSTIRNECQGDPELFRQEYPSNDVEAFIAGGRPFFDVRALRDYLGNVSDPEFVGDLEGSRPVFHEADKGYLKIWAKPDPRKSYIIGADVAEGLADGDYSAAVVLERTTLKQVAEFHGHLDPDLFGVELHKLGRWYNWAQLAVEANNHGLTTLTTLANGHVGYGTGSYPNLYRREQFDEASRKSTVKLGWRTDLRSRPLMLDTLAQHIRERVVGLNSKDLIQELLSFIKSDGGKPEAAPGAHDDLVIAIAIALQAVGARGQDAFMPGFDISTLSVRRKNE